MVMNRKVFVHFSSVDPILSSLSKLVIIQDVAPRHPRQFFTSLCGEIIGQQLSGKVADVIEGRFTKLFKGRVTPQKVAVMPDERLRETGMSWSKVRFIKDLANKVLQKEVYLTSLSKSDDAEVIRELTKIKGIGPWTAEMFLMFTLGRQDVFSFGDLGLRRAIQKAYGLKREPSVRQLARISIKWKPYRSWAARILWKSLELQVQK
jgi:DNA-3-methyladenine glycosylase II